jgi:Zn-dependent protease with chaperone function
VVVFATALVISALLLGGMAGRFIDTSRWAIAHPGMAVVCWVGVLIGTATSVSGLVAVALLAPPTPAHGLIEWLDHCLPHGHAGLVVAAVVSSALVAGCIVRFARGVPRLWRAVVHRRRHREMLCIVAKADDQHPDVLVIDHPIPVAYCVPARHRPIVVSTGAKARLDASELAAVLAHERAHLRQRHHLLLFLLDLMYTLLSWLPTVRRAMAGLPTLLEMAADDVAARRCGRQVLSTALLRLSVLSGAAGALAATGVDTGDRGHALARRLDRLTTDAAASSGAARVLAWVTAIGMVGSPLAMATLAVLALPLPC